MHESRTALAVLAAVAVSAGFATNAEAVLCDNNNQHGCWRSLSGPNYSQVAVSRSVAGMGIACAVVVGNGADWGGTIHCFAPAGSSGATLLGIGGQLIQNPGWFSSTDPGRRMVSVTIEPAYSTIVLIHALRSDGTVFVASTNWPLGPNPALYFAPHTAAPPPGLRSISYVKGVGLTGVTTSNQMFVLNGLQWILQPGNHVMVAGNSTVAGRSMGLLGTFGTSTQVATIQGGGSPPPLPEALQLASFDPNASFTSGVGRFTPLAAGSSSVLALLPGNCPAGTFRPCIRRSTLSFGIWGPWQAVSTNDITFNPDHAAVFSVQEGHAFRLQPGEIWVIAGGHQLKFWAP